MRSDGPRPIAAASEYECKKGSGVFYDTASKCTANCVRKIATLDNWCWEYNPKDSNVYRQKILTFF